MAVTSTRGAKSVAKTTARSIAKRIENSFDKASDQDKIFQYLDWLRNTIVSYSQNLSRLTTFLILLIAAFELVSDSSGLQISIGSFKISKGSMVVEFLPCLVAYLYFQIVVDSRRIVSVRNAFMHTFQIWSKPGERNDLDVMVLPSLPLYWNPAVYQVHDELQRASDKVEYWAANVFQLVILIGVVTFQAQAYYVLYNSFKVLHITWYASLTITVFCLSAAVIHYFIDRFVFLIGKWRPGTSSLRP